MSDPRAVANYVLERCGELEIRVTNLQLQKLLFFCQVWALIKLNRTLITYPFEAWEYGPVSPSVFHQFKRFGSGPIEGKALCLNSITGEYEDARLEYDPETDSLLRQVVAFYGRMSASKLVELTHEVNGPWYRAWNHKGSVNPGMAIQNEHIRSFYATYSGSTSAH